MPQEIENIALFDMDGTLCDYNTGLFKSLEKLRAPNELIYHPPVRDDAPKYIKERSNLIRLSEEWWANLPKLKIGFDIWKAAGDLGYRRMILTQGPKTNPYAWSGKKIWIDRNLGEDTDITMTRDKGLVYGKIFVDDYPGYIERWLKHRPRGLVIMPASNENKNFSHRQVLRYDGRNLDQVVDAMQKVKLGEK